MFAKKLALIVVFVTLVAGVACCDVPPMISYQGKLLQPSGVPVPDGTYSIQFAIYDVPTGGTALWSETNPSVQVKGGLFATMLGSVNNLPANVFNSSSRFFGVKVGGDPEMTPRQQVASSAFAFRSSVAGTVDDGAITAAKLAPGVAVPAGSIMEFAGSTAPVGWLLCDGSAVSRVTYASLLAAVGTAYGPGDGTATFNLPSLQGRVPFGQSSDPAFTALGQTGGEKTHQLTIAEMPKHHHANGGYCDGYMVPQGSYYGMATCGWTDYTGGDQPHNVLNPYLVVNYIIKY